MTFKRALVSVSDKSGLIDFIRPLVEAGMTVISTGGTAKELTDAGLPVTAVSEQTGFPEVMDGRVKTLHPKIHMALLARKENPADSEVLEKFEIEPFDLVVGNLYPFEKALLSGKSEADLIEFIDIGGPSFLRAAAKSHERIVTVVDPTDYPKVIAGEYNSESGRKKLAAKVFSHTAAYDSVIAQALTEDLPSPDLGIGGELVSPLRYGENPQQQSKWYSLRGSQSGIHQADVLQGKPLSYNNILDLDAAIRTLREFDDSASCVAVKHLNPCGVAASREILEAIDLALLGDPVSVFGGIVAVNKPIDSNEAMRLSQLFLECIVAPKFTDKARSVLSKKQNLRLLEWPDLLTMSPQPWNFRSVLGGFLVQSEDRVSGWSEDWKVLGEPPTEKLKQSMTLAWKVCAHLKSNAIAIASGQQSVGLGMGQVNRVDAVEQAIMRMKRFHPDCVEPVITSDAFFPFADSIEKISEAGIRWIVQPGGSMRDTEVISMAEKCNVNLVLTGTRHFQH